MKKKTKFGIAGILSATALAFSSIVAMAADVDVYAEGAYTATELVVSIYADINTDPLVSAGVQLAYDNSRLTVASTQKNDTDWYFGTSDAKYPYQDPQDTGSAVVFLCGKIDENAPTAGVAGARKLIGTVTFTRSESGIPEKDPTTGNAAAYFGSSLGLGVVRPAPDEFANFVTTNETVLDASGVDLSSVLIYERGDANASGGINVNDILKVKSLINSVSFPPYADCNSSGNINVNDILCVKSKL